MWLRLNRQFEKTKVIQQLANQLLKGIAIGKMDRDVLRDFSYLGQQAHAGDEKDVALRVIDRFIKKILNREKRGILTYNEDELEFLIRLIPATLNNTNRPGNDQNYVMAVEILANIWRWLGTCKVTSCIVSTREALRLLSLYSVKWMTVETSLAYLEIAAECDSDMVFDMAQAAIKEGEYTLAGAALSKLEAMANNSTADRHISQETKANLLGITADLATYGSAWARRAETALHTNGELFKPSLRQALADAFDYQYSAGRFDIADKINLLVSEVPKMKTVNLDGPFCNSTTF